MTLFFIHLPQDLDLLLPVLREFKAKRAAARVWVTDRVHHASPRVRSALDSLALPVKVVPYMKCFFGLWPPLGDCGALVTAAESTARAHRVAHLLTKKAGHCGLRTYTIQQGLENVGLNHSDPRQAAGRVGFASQTIFLWGNAATLDSKLPEDIRRRCVPVGCPKEALSPPFPERRSEWTRLIAVFENLHRHPASYARSFLSELKRTAQACPETVFLLKPHHNQRWSARYARAEWEDVKNIVLADPADPYWEPFTSTSLLGICDAAITSPSTVALDAARAQRPVAVVGGPSLERFTPLTRLENAGDWIDFVRREHEPSARADELSKARAFAARWVLPGPAAERIAEAVQGGV